MIEVAETGRELSVDRSTVPGMVNQGDEVVQLRGLLEDLLALSDKGPDEARTPRGRRYDVVRIKSVVALSLHTFRLGKAVATLVDAGMGIETAPSVRSVLECGLTSQWMLQYGDEASYGFATEAQRQRRAMAETVRKLTAVMQLDNADGILKLIDADLQYVIDRTAANPTARRFDLLCKDFAVGDAYYFTYRVLSEFVHVGPTLAEAYVDSHEPVSFRTEPKRLSNETTWLFQTCCGVVWAARAIDMLDRAHPNREFLRGAARQLGIPLELQLSGEAVVKREQDRQRRKREQRNREAP